MSLVKLDGTTYIQPDGDFVFAIIILGREVPEVQLRGVLLVRNGKQARIRLADVKVNIRDRRAIDNEFYEFSAFSHPTSPAIGHYKLLIFSV